MATITYFLIWFEEREFVKGNWKFALPVLLLFLSAMMVSKVKYPTFKKVNLRGSRSFIVMVLGAIVIGLLLPSVGNTRCRLARRCSSCCT